MFQSSAWQRWLTGLWLALLAWSVALVSANAAVPNQDATPAYAEEQTILQQEQDTSEPGLASPSSGREHFDRHFLIPPGFMDQQELILQRGGNTWRTVRNGPLATLAGILLLVVPFALLGFHETVGPAPEPPPSGRRLQRFSNWERLVHWAAAITFLILAASGLIILFGKKIFLPWMGHDVFYWFAWIAKYLHNFVGPLFIASSIAMFITFLRKNLFERWDWQWIKKGGGLRTHEHIPAGFFNAGEKLWFWGGVTLLGLLMTCTGLMLDFPYLKQIGANIAITRYLLQVADTLHLTGATLYMAAAMGHIYIGTWGTPGTYHGMRHGDVDADWARAHHEIWYDQATRPGQLPEPDRGRPPAGAAPNPQR